MHLIAIEGIDQAGKKTQTRMLDNFLRPQGLEVKTISFPIYRSPSGRIISRYLQGMIHYPFTALCMLYSLNSWENLTRLNRTLFANDYVVANRYTPSGPAYGIAGGLSVSWLRNLDRGLPEPDLVLVLDVPVRSSFSRKFGKRDVHEANAKYLTKIRRTYLRLSGEFNWRVVSGTGSKDAVCRRLTRAVRLHQNVQRSNN